MTLEELKFSQHHVVHGGIQATVDFPNGYGASVVGGGRGLYGDGMTTYELAVIHGEVLCYATPITGDVLGWQTQDEITALLQAIEALPENYACNHQRTTAVTLEEEIAAIDSLASLSE
jgi:hypothetical protein